MTDQIRKTDEPMVFEAVRPNGTILYQFIYSPRQGCFVLPSLSGVKGDYVWREKESGRVVTACRDGRPMVIEK